MTQGTVDAVGGEQRLLEAPVAWESPGGYLSVGCRLLSMSSGTSPLEELERLIQRMNRQFEEASRSWEGTALGSGTGTVSLDLVERDDEFLVTVDLPGFERDDVDIAVTDHTLRVEAEREVETEEGDEQYIRRERRQASTRRSVQLPEEVDTGAVSARMRNGVLTVTLPKLEATTARHIDIEGE